MPPRNIPPKRRKRVFLYLRGRKRVGLQRWSLGNSGYFFYLFGLLALLCSVASLLLSIGFTTMPTSNGNGLGINLQHQHHHNSTTSNPILALLTFILPVLLVLIDFKFKNEPTSVFQAHPITIKVAVANLLVFALAFGVEFTFHPCYLSTTCAALLRTTILFCGSLSVASSSSLLFSDAWRPLIYLFYALLSLINLHGLVREWCGWVHHGIKEKLQIVCTDIQQWYVRRSAPLLPL